MSKIEKQSWYQVIFGFSIFSLKIIQFWNCQLIFFENWSNDLDDVNACFIFVKEFNTSVDDFKLVLQRSKFYVFTEWFKHKIDDFLTKSFNVFKYIPIESKYSCVIWKLFKQIHELHCQMRWVVHQDLINQEIFIIILK